MPQVLLFYFLMKVFIKFFGAAESGKATVFNPVASISGGIEQV
jgi:hypothetical protein